MAQSERQEEGGVVFQLPYPPSVNRIWRNVGSKTLLSATGRAYRLSVAKWLIAHGVSAVFPPEAPLRVVLHVYPPDRRKRDLDNVPKAIFDALTHAGLWGDDSQIDEFKVKRMPVLKGGAIGVVVHQMGAA